MLYVKIDSSGQPLEVPKSYSQVKADLLEENNSVIPAENVFSTTAHNYGYGLCPYVEPPVPATGKRYELAIPTKQADNTYLRTYKEVEATEQEIENRKIEIRADRRRVLQRYIDSVSPVRWNAMSEADKAAVTAYRQQLLDLPSAQGFPFIALPPLPDCLK